MPPATTIQQLNNNSNNENTVKSTPFWLSVREKWCLEKGIAKEIENYEPTHLKTLLERSYAEIKNKHGWTSETTILFYRKWFGHGLNNSLNCLAALLLHNCDELSRIFPCILLIRNRMIFLVQFGINKHLLIFSKTTNFVSL